MYAHSSTYCTEELDHTSNLHHHLSKAARGGAKSKKIAWESLRPIDSKSQLWPQVN